jgi:hypothetical protein
MSYEAKMTKPKKSTKKQVVNADDNQLKWNAKSKRLDRVEEDSRINPVKPLVVRLKDLQFWI